METFWVNNFLYLIKGSNQSCSKVLAGWRDQVCDSDGCCLLVFIKKCLISLIRWQFKKSFSGMSWVWSCDLQVDCVFAAVQMFLAVCLLKWSAAYLQQLSSAHGGWIWTIAVIGSLPASLRVSADTAWDGTLIEHRHFRVCRQGFSGGDTFSLLFHSWSLSRKNRSSLLCTFPHLNNKSHVWHKPSCALLDLCFFNSPETGLNRDPSTQYRVICCFFLIGSPLLLLFFKLHKLLIIEACRHPSTLVFCHI